MLPDKHSVFFYTRTLVEGLIIRKRVKICTQKAFDYLDPIFVVIQAMDIVEM